MIDLNHIARYQENNRIEAKKAAVITLPDEFITITSICSLRSKFSTYSRADELKLVVLSLS